MKFDYAIGNPPYQKEVGTTDLKNGVDVRVQSIFNLFQEEIDKFIEKKSCLIYPGGGWIHRNRNGLQKFGLTQINDPHLACLVYYPNSKEVFSTNVSIGDGISVVIKDYHKSTQQFEYIYISNGKQTKVMKTSPGDELFVLNPANQSIIDKVKQFVLNNHLDYINKRVKGPGGGKSIFGISSEFVEKNPNLVKIYNIGDILADDEIKLLTNDKSGKVGRATWYIIKKKDIPYMHELFDKYKIVKPTSNTKFELLEQQTAFGRSRILMGYFNTPQEAKNYLEYLNSNCVQFLVNLTVGTANIGKFVPDFINFTNNQLINFSKDIDNQLYTLFELTDEEIKHICNTVDKEA